MLRAVELVKRQIKVLPCRLPLLLQTLSTPIHFLGAWLLDPW